ncbi:HD-GYP domain-containing protein [Methylophaga sp. OBS1]|uniref:HD-GYP domain-containing protein n=1 Tax=Methylophaga sp. OBS1 TaxID=2991933 RepID=UPI00224D3639|nr:HD-GYP domain-containing protein [Methylophaga sp. OBS1]MCX4191423.1 HD-GYP domain-containing protein [Methylophaga sp. OBS1]MCX4191631.1 HD-GYP domain-containing protein [Methylophaga sp. OBS1]
MDARVISMLANQPDTLNGRLEILHQAVLQKIPAITRLSCALYDSKTDELKTFLTSCITGSRDEPQKLLLSDCPHLAELAEKIQYCVVNEADSFDKLDSNHADWLREKGYRSTFIVPMLHGQRFIGFIFFDAIEPEVFSESAQRELVLHVQVINMTIAAEMSMVQSLLATTQVARDFTDMRDFETGLHLDRMAHYAHIIAQQLAPKYQLSDEWIEHIFMFAALHDIGKIGVPDSILCKPGRHNEEERAIMKTHVNKGVVLLRRLLADYDLVDMRDTEVMQNIVAYHHEYLDGSGYPNGLHGEQIPLEARIATVADIFDALTSRRPYKKAWSVDEALIELQSMTAAGKLDPECVQAVIDERDQFEHIVNLLADEQEKRSPDDDMNLGR